MAYRDLMPPAEQARLITEHASAPRQKGLLPGVAFIGTRDLDGFSSLKMQAVLKDGVFENVRWDGEGTKVFVAACSILCGWVQGKKIEDYNKVLELWEKMLAQIEVVEQAAFLGDVRALEYVIRLRPDRVREVVLPWTTLSRLISGVVGVRPPAAPLAA